MAQLSRAAFVSKYNGLFADNITREISEADVRELVQDIRDSFFNILDHATIGTSFGSLTGWPTDSQRLVEFGNWLIATVRGGVNVELNTLKKIVDTLLRYDFVIRGDGFFLKNFGGVSYSNVTGTNNYIISASSYIPPSITNTSRYFVRIPNTNTGPCTLKMGSLPAYDIVKGTDSPLVEGDLIAGNTYLLAFDGFNFHVVGNESSIIDGGTYNSRPKRIRIRRGTADQWQSSNPIPDNGELCLETDTKKAKVGDGVNNYNSLEYWFDGSTNLKFKGYFEDETDLETQHPTGDIGDTAINLDTNTFWMWNVDTSEWVDSSKPVPAFVIDSVLTEGSANAAPSGGTFTAIANLMSLISGLADDLAAIETEVGEIDVVQKWVSVNAVSGTVTFDLQNKLNKFFTYTGSANYTWAFINNSYAADDVVNIQSEIYFPTGVTSHKITLPTGNHIDSNGEAITEIELFSSEETTLTVYAQKNGSVWKWWWSQTYIIDGGTT